MCKNSNHNYAVERCFYCKVEFCWDCGGNKGHLSQNYLSGERTDKTGLATIWITCPNCQEVNYF